MIDIVRFKTYIYVIGAAEFTPVKVGFASNPKARLAALQTGNPYRLSILETFDGTMLNERRLHRKLEQYKTVGEWFDIPGNPVEFVRSIIEKPILDELVSNRSPHKDFDPEKEISLGWHDGWHRSIEKKYS